MRMVKLGGLLRIAWWYFPYVLRDRQVELAHLGIVMPFSGHIPGWVVPLVL